jgi:pantoate kinase
LAARTARAFSPAGISSFFEICDTAPNGKPIRNLERVGSRGGGFVIDIGVLTEVSLTESKKSSIQVFINNKPAPGAETTRTVANMLLERAHRHYEVNIRHRVDVPIGAGYGSSAAGALSAVLALGRAMATNLTAFQAGKIAHAAEVKCQTGLGTVGPVALGGCVVTVEPGAPGCAVIDRIPTMAEHRIVTGYYKPILTKKILKTAAIRKKVNKNGRETVDKILADPSLENFMRASREFAKKAGFATPMTEKLVGLAEKAGAIGAAQNMIGEAVHALTTIHNAQRIAEVFKKILPSANVLIAKVDAQGARLMG